MDEERGRRSHCMAFDVVRRIGLERIFGGEGEHRSGRLRRRLCCLQAQVSSRGPSGLDWQE
jgi:hypothetical protein